MTFRVVSACCLLTIFAASLASGAGVNLSWNDCSAAGLMNMNFACNSYTGSSILVASFGPPDGITKLVGASAVIDIQTDSTPMPSWWQMSAGGCRRAGSLRLDFIASPQSCTDYWSAIATRSFAYLAGFGGHPNRARITISVGIPEALAGPVEDGTEYHAFRLIMDNARTVSSESCSGCTVPTCLILNSLWLYQPPGLGDHRICGPLDSNMANWRSASFCPPVDSPPPWWPLDCLTTPTLRRSWGLIKGLSR